jgi:hypothetical protein
MNFANVSRLSGEINSGTGFARTVKSAGMAATWLLIAGVGAGQVFAQSAGQGQAPDQRTGVAKPQPVTLSSDDSDAQAAGQAAAPVVVPAAKPSAAVPMAAPATGASDTYGPYVPYRAPGTAGAGTASPASAAFDPDASIVTEATAGRSERRALNGTSSLADPDAGIVTHVPWLPNEIPDGALLKVKLGESISTETTKPGSRFSAELTEAVVGDGRVYLPAGSMLKGRVTWTHSGSRISGGAAIHLEARSVVLPDGTEYAIHARVIDTNSWQNTKVDREGTIKRKDHGKEALATVGLATGGGAAAGAMIGGVPGALIGAGVGAGVSAVVWLKQDRQAVLPKDLGVVFSLTAPMAMTPASATAVPAKAGEAGGE